MRIKWLRYGLVIVGAVLALCIVFGAGIFVGRVSGRLVPRPAPWFAAFFSGAHGAVGTIRNIDGQTITLKLRDGSSQTVLFDRETRIEKNRQRLAFSDLKIGDQILVIGSPNDQGEIKARWVRVLDNNSPHSPPVESYSGVILTNLNYSPNPRSNGV
ncbi:MAG: hypothetical protein A2Z03_04005 [Chloroflexi bacterium RBG_16_56_8]|nr:MAG: hypothetical protein A2Z03_04005 [Chloroflexi bacterium RBG_16_56_8]